MPITVAPSAEKRSAMAEPIAPPMPATTHTELSRREFITSPSLRLPSDPLNRIGRSGETGQTPSQRTVGVCVSPCGQRRCALGANANEYVNEYVLRALS